MAMTLGGEGEKEAISRDIPLLCPEVLEVPEMSTVQVIKHNGHSFVGLCRENPAKTKRPDELILYDGRQGDLNNPGVPITFFQRTIMKGREIAKLFLLESLKPEEERPERTMLTKILCSTEEVTHILNALDEMRIKVVVISGMIEGADRFGTMGWLCLVVKGTLICMDILALERQKEGGAEFWDMIDKRLFKNKEIVKVCFDGNRLIDFLFHGKGIKIENYFDTQVGEMFIRCQENQEKMPQKVDDVKEGYPYNWKYVTVSKCYKEFVPDLVLEEELELLEKYEDAIFIEKSPYLERPAPSTSPYYKAHALAVKYLADVYEVQMKILNSHITQCMKEQMEYHYGSRSSVMMQLRHIPPKVMEIMHKGSPYISRK